MKKRKNVQVGYEAPKVSNIQLSSEQVCIAGSASSESGSSLEDMFETEGGWASLGN